MAIKIAQNKIEIDGNASPYGGEVVGMDYSINFSSSPSSINLTLASSDGEYEDVDLNSEESVLVEFGSFSINMLPVAYKKSLGTSARTLTVELDDMSLKYLDKTFVLLSGKHVSQLELPRVIRIGSMFVEKADGQSGELQRWYGGYRADVQVRYDIRELANAIDDIGVPIHKSFYNFLSEFKAYKLSSNDKIVNKSFFRSNTGTLRSVLSSIAGELGFVFFWNNSGQQGNKVLNYSENEGYLDFVKIEEDIDIQTVRNTIEKYTKNVCNIEDDTEEVSIRGNYMKGAIGSFDVTSSRSRSRSQPFARFKFKDVITSPITGSSVHLTQSNIRIRYDLELLMKASLISEEFYRKYVLLKLTAGGFQNLNKYTFENETIVNRNQALNADAEEASGLLVGEWANKKVGEKFPLNIVRNSAVEALYDFEVIPSVLSGDPSEVKEVENKAKGINTENSNFGINVNRYINENEDFVLGLRDENPVWVACTAKKDKKFDTFMKGDSQNSIYNQINFLAQNFGRFYYASKGSANNPALTVERNFSKRNYGGSAPEFVFSDLAVTESPLESVFSFVNNETQERSIENYYIVKYGQSQSPIKVLPTGTPHPTRRYFTVDGFDKITSIYYFLRTGSNSVNKPVTHTTSNTDLGDIDTISYVEQDDYKSFKSETFGVSSPEDVPLTSENGVTVVGGTLPQGAGSIPTSSYTQIQSDRQSKDPYQYPSDLDFGILLYDAYKSTSSKSNQIDLDFQFKMLEGNLPSDTSFALKAANRSLFVLETPSQKPVKESKFAQQWGGSIYLDEIDEELIKQGLPFTLASVTDSMSMNYSYSLDDVLNSVRTAYIPDKDFEKVTSVDIEDVSFNISDLLEDSVDAIPPEFPLKGSSTLQPNISLLTDNLKEVMKLYVDENFSNSISRDFKVSGFGFGDDNLIPSVYEGLESISVTVNEGGVSTTIKIGNKRRSKEAIDIRKNMLLRSIAGQPAGRVATNQVNSIFSNKLLSRF